MNNRENGKISLAIGILTAAAWCAIILIVGKTAHLGFGGWFGFLYVLVCVGVIVCCNTMFRAPKNDSGTLGIPQYYSVMLLILAVLINGVYIFTERKNLTPYIVAADIVLLAIYFGIIIFTSVYQRDLTVKVNKVEGNTAFATTVSRTLGTLLAQADDPEVHKALAGLKEKVDYSTNSTQNAVDEPQILAGISKLQDALNANNKDDALNAISEIGSLWAARNTKL